MTDFEKSLELVGAAQSGDQDALSQLFSRYYDRVRAVVRARMGARLRLAFDSADLSQETFITAARIIERLEIRSEASLINWLAKIAENQISDAAKSIRSGGKRDVDKQREVDPNPDLHPEDGKTKPLDKVDKAERHEILLSALENMPADIRELIVQRHFAGASWAEIAEQLDKPTADAARMAYGKARTALAKALLAAGYEQSGVLFED